MVTKWQCTTCGNTTRSSSRPTNATTGRCKGNSSGNHIWMRID